MIHKGTQNIHTERLLLRRYRESDTEDMFDNYAGDERVAKFMPWIAYERKEDAQNHGKT